MTLIHIFPKLAGQAQCGMEKSMETVAGQSKEEEEVVVGGGRGGTGGTG